MLDEYLPGIHAIMKATGELFHTPTNKLSVRWNVNEAVGSVDQFYYPNPLKTHPIPSSCLPCPLPCMPITAHHTAPRLLFHSTQPLSSNIPYTHPGATERARR